ncbi:hypothetical protein AMTR_s00033p00169010 [Amborella trichopoda]|uniref:Uncharacterized protein n=1 Tax=Amborella trichopoda TaxID=13333 RepID=U5CWE3_AMBTC|nr:hypothetical protein AMTR_s00033p00169010 [Amborella trichopoda]
MSSPVFVVELAPVEGDIQPLALLPQAEPVQLPAFLPPLCNQAVVDGLSTEEENDALGRDVEVADVEEGAKVGVMMEDMGMDGDVPFKVILNEIKLRKKARVVAEKMLVKDVIKNSSDTIQTQVKKIDKKRKGKSSC